MRTTSRSPSERIGVGVIGHTGRLGKPLMNLLRFHPFVKIAYTESRNQGIEGRVKDAQVVFLALPESESAQYLPKLGGKKIIDLSLDHRADKDWAYGLTELRRTEIAKAERVANPGCYATSIILGLAPLQGLISDVRISSTSGISGAGKQVQGADNFKVYKEGNKHQHIAEIERALGITGVLFVPQVIETADRGIVSTIFAKYSGQGEAVGFYDSLWGSEPFIRMTNDIQTKNVVGTNFCDIKVLQFGDEIIVMTALDNVMKGGSSQAVQNFNLMLGFDEKIGLG